MYLHMSTRSLLNQIPQKTQEKLGKKILLILLRRTLKDLYNTLPKNEREGFDKIKEEDVENLSLFVQKNKDAFTHLFTENLIQLQKELKK